jgi:hypothetical protein
MQVLGISRCAFGGAIRAKVVGVYLRRAILAGKKKTRWREGPLAAEVAVVDARGEWLRAATVFVYTRSTGGRWKFVVPWTQGRR